MALSTDAYTWDYCESCEEYCFMKVSYIDLDGYEQTAYLDFELTAHPGVWMGTHKHTDDQVAVRWNGEMWREETFSGRQENS